MSGSNDRYLSKVYLYQISRLLNNQNKCYGMFLCHAKDIFWAQMS